MPRPLKPPPPKPGSVAPSPQTWRGGESQMSGIQAALTPEMLAAAAAPTYDVNDPQACAAFAQTAESVGDLPGALGAYERMFRLNTRDLNALQNMLRLSRALDDFVRESRCLATMSQLVEDPKQQADLLIQAAHVSWRRRNEPEKAAFGLSRALELDPDRLDAFLSLTEIYHTAGAWKELEVAYQKMIQAHGSRAQRNPVLLAKLWRKLAVLLAQQDRFEEAEFAQQSASALDPDDIKNHATVYEIYRRWPSRWREAVTALQILIERESDTGEQLRNLRMLAETYVEHAQIDAAFCVLRVMDFLGAAEPDEVALVSELQPKLPKVPDATLTPEMWLNYIYPTDFPHELSQVYALIALAVHDVLTRELEDHGTTPKNQIDIDKPLLFNNLIRKVSVIFGLDRVPEIYTRDSGVEGLGIIDGLLDPPGFIIDRSLLSGRTPHDIAFCATRQLALQKQSVYMAGVSTSEQLKGFLMAAIKFALPDAPIPASRDLNQVLKAFKAALTPEQQQVLTNLVTGLVSAGGEVALEHYLDRAEDVANRLAFLICDDLHAASAAIQRADGINPNRPPNKRLEAVIHFAISPEYIAVRQLLGLAVG
jgi:tetratricopeptide (TPR) repeat protein